MCPFTAEGNTTTNCGDATSGFAFVVAGFGKFNNDGFINGTIAATEEDAVVRFGKYVFMADGTRVTADRVKIGTASSLFDVYAGDAIVATSDAIIRGVEVLNAPLPIMDPTCEELYLADIEEPCSAPDVVVPPGFTLDSLAPGAYGRLFIDAGATLRLPDLGTYTFCSIRMDKYSNFSPVQQVTVNVTPFPGTVNLGAGAIMDTDSGLPFVLNVGGSLLRISQGAVVNASVRVPYGTIKLQRDAAITGCMCADAIKTDKHVTLICEDGTGP